MEVHFFCFFCFLKKTNAAKTKKKTLFFLNIENAFLFFQFEIHDAAVRIISFSISARRAQRARLRCCRSVDAFVVAAIGSIITID